MSATERIARVLHDWHAERLERTAPFERCPGRPSEMALAARIAAMLGLAT